MKLSIKVQPSLTEVRVNSAYSAFRKGLNLKAARFFINIPSLGSELVLHEQDRLKPEVRNHTFRKGLNLVRFFLLFLVVFTLTRPGLVTKAHAVAPGVAVEVQMNEALVQAADGLIICDTQFGRVLCETAYSQDIYGVIEDTPAVALINTQDENTRPIITSGQVYVQVTTQNGAIKKGDYITSSEIKGVGQKAARSGQMLGIALEDYSSENSKEIARILVELNIRPVVLEARTVVDKVRNQIRIIAGPARVGFRHALAALVTAVGVAVGVGFFGKVVKSGVESVGRNPRAMGKIQVSMTLNLVLTGAVMAVGLVAAYFILTI